MLAGTISTSAVASMKPAPSATKYRRYERSQFLWTMMAPPNTFAPAAVSPSSTLVRMGDMREKNSRSRGWTRGEDLASCGESEPPIFNSHSDFVIPSEARDLHFAADCRSLASLGMTIHQCCPVK